MIAEVTDIVDRQVDEQKAQQAHAEAYSQGNTSNMSSESLGAAGKCSTELSDVLCDEM